MDASDELDAAVRQVPSPTDRLIVEAEFPRLTPSAIFGLWTTPEGLVRWWPREADLVDPRVGGAYHLSWPTRGWHLRGHYTAFEPDRLLAFTWTWDHDPEYTKEVRVELQPAPSGGTRLILTHGPYTESAHDRELRQSHWEGWTHFLAALGTANSAG